MELNNTHNDMEINAAIIKARELLEEIPDVDSIIGAWDVYCAHMDGPCVVDPYTDDVVNNPNPQDQRKGMQILADIYNRLAPFEDRIVSLFKILDFAKLSVLDEIVRDRLSYLNCYCSEFHTYQPTMTTLGLQDIQEQQRKQPRPKKQSKAEIKLQSQELQEVKSKLIAAEIIVDGVWRGTPAEFGCLVLELQCERGVNNHGEKAWTACKKWAGYDGSIASARSAIEKNQDTQGPTADKIRAICRYNK